MRTQKDIEEFREIYVEGVESGLVYPELIRRYKFAVNLLDYVLENPTTFNNASDFNKPCLWCGGSGKAEKTNYFGEYPQEYGCPVCNGTGYDSSTSSSIDSEEPNAESVGLSEDLAVFCFDCEHYAYDRRWCTLTKITMNRNNSCPEYDSLHRKEITE